MIISLPEKLKKRSHLLNMRFLIKEGYYIFKFKKIFTVLEDIQGYGGTWLWVTVLPLCGAHLFCELNNLMEQGTLWADELHEFLLACTLPVLYVLAKAAEEVYKHYDIISALAQQEEPKPQAGKQGKPKQSTGRNLLNQLKKYRENVSL